MPKIALIGAGSVVFARTLISDILTFPELRDSTIALMDINPERLGLITALAQRMVDQEGAEIEIQSTLDQVRGPAGCRLRDHGEHVRSSSAREQR